MEQQRELSLERHCPVCGKLFICYPGHVYKIKDARSHWKSVCSWKCQRIWEKEGSGVKP